MGRSINYIKNLLFPNNYYWYSVKFVYRNKPNGAIIFDWKTQIGFKNKKDCLIDRKAKKAINPLHKMQAVESLLCNGYLSAEFICYLGWFSK